MTRWMIYLTAAILIIGMMQFFAVRAGSLNPSATPVGTMKTTEESYNVIVGTNDASGVSANINGDILQQLKAVRNGFGL
ncbi:MAG: hypothetical protein AAB444_01450 [Patescibacteria group bacterium]